MSMKNVDVQIKGTQMIITVDLSPKAMAAGERSTSGKTTVIASTKGNKDFTMADGKTVTMGLSAYVK